MYNLSIIKATCCPLSEQLRSITFCEQFCDNFYKGCTESRLKQNCVMCPAINKLMDIGMCADNCDYYEGDGKDVESMMCSFIEVEAHEDINLETDNHNCINSPISKPNTVKHTLWWKIGTILSYLILIGMALWMLFQE